MKDFTKMIEHYRFNVRLTNEVAWDIIACFAKTISEIKFDDEKKPMCVIKDIHEIMYGKHFDEFLAEHQVSEMFYINEKGEKISREEFTHSDAKRIYDKMVKNISNDITIWDVYVALNAQYNDYINLYKSWFEKLTEEELKDKIIKSTIVNWFEDADASNHKVWDYFRVV